MRDDPDLDDTVVVRRTRTLVPVPPPAGKVFLVGAGPGDPDLLTLKAVRCLAAAEVVIHDALIDPIVLELVPKRAERIYAGKRCGRHGATQDEINALLVHHARLGRTVVRLKGGDPFLFGRGGEEARALVAAGIEYEVVPGVTAGTAVPALAGIPVTQRGLASAVTFVTGHPGSGQGAVDWSGLARVPGTLVVFMGLHGLAAIARALIDGGRAPSTPAAAISNGTMPDQRIVVGTLEDLPARVEGAALPAPTLLVIGEVVSMRASLLSVVRTAAVQ